MDQDPRASAPEAIASGVGDSARASVEAGEGGASTPAVTDEMMVLGGWGEVTVFRKHFHYLDLMATRLAAQIDYIHKKQSIIFSLSAGILAVLSERAGDAAVLHRACAGALVGGSGLCWSDEADSEHRRVLFRRPRRQNDTDSRPADTGLHVGHAGQSA